MYPFTVWFDNSKFEWEQPYLKILHKNLVLIPYDKHVTRLSIINDLNDQVYDAK